MIGRVIVHNPIEHAGIVTVECTLHNNCMDKDVKSDVKWAEVLKLRCGTRVRPEKDHALGVVGVRDVLCNYFYSRNNS